MKFYATYTAILLPQTTLNVSTEGHNNYSQLNHKYITQKRSQNAVLKPILLEIINDDYIKSINENKRAECWECEGMMCVTWQLLNP